MTVLVGYLPTPEGEAAFTAALDEARRRSEPLLVVNSPREGAPVSAALASEAMVEKLSATAREAGVEIDVRQQSHTGELSDEIVRVAEENDVSVVVIGLRRRSPVGKLLMGSTAQRILLDANRPVLAVKP